MSTRPRKIIIFIVTIVAGFALFILPNLFFGITKINGGLIGINLLFTALFQLVSVSTLIYFSLKLLKKDFQFVGLSCKYWRRDGLLGLLTGLAWTALQFGWIVPNTGDVARDDIAQMVATMDGTWLGLLSYVALGMIGGGITEEIFNRGYFITALKDIFDNAKTGLWVASVLSILIFALGHLPTDALSWFDILVPTVAYTILFLMTKRLTASIVAHGIYNAAAISLTHYLYYG